MSVFNNNVDYCDYYFILKYWFMQMHVCVVYVRL